MWNKTFTSQLKKYGKEFMVERKVESNPVAIPETEEVNISDTGFVDFSQLDNPSQLNAKPTDTFDIFTLTALKLNAKNMAVHGEVGSSFEGQVKLLVLKSFSNKLPLLETDVIFENATLNAQNKIEGGIRYIITKVLQSVCYKTTELLSYMIEEAKHA